MTALTSMISRMKETGIYKLDSDTLVDYELRAYAAGLDMVINQFSELENESFIRTAKGYGLSNRENLLKFSPCENTEDRRNSVMGCCSITPNNFTKSDMENVFKIRGQNTEVFECPAENKIYVNCMELNEDEKKKIIDTAKMFLPAHLDAELDFRCISWNNIDSEKCTFDKMEGFGLTWNDIDNYGNGLIKI
jgi:hypothetical protein